MKSTAIEATDPWESLKAFTAARIALGRTGTSIPLLRLLEFKLAHAHARDAVYAALNTSALIAGLQHLGFPLLQLHSKAQNRQQFLQRPDLGRQPDETSVHTINEHAGNYDICIIAADGLSASAVNNNAVPLIATLTQLFMAAKFSLAPICLAVQARVALADHIAFGLHAKLSVILIGERPGLSSAESIGAYITFNSKPGLTDEARNCVSNIRHHGLETDLAAGKIFYIIQEAFKRKLTGIYLKDNAGLLNG